MLVINYVTIGLNFAGCALLISLFIHCRYEHRLAERYIMSQLMAIRQPLDYYAIIDTIIRRVFLLRKSRGGRLAIGC